ncbi:MAG: RNA polymerase sporulation sigma factor SigH [Candidatus Aenigmarchaeota archaeon]|nr:RNA polymerase sporulation sigma factor SigH [Candidatus Aenigmarchaeota archaeon]
MAVTACDLKRSQREKRRKNGNGNRWSEYKKLSDNELCFLAQKDDIGAQNFLLNKYEYLVHFKARFYFVIGGDHDDTIQEGTIGLYKAIRDYRPGKTIIGNEICSFRSFALLCITRQIITAVKTATRQKHIPLNTRTSLEKPIFSPFDKGDSDDRTLGDIIPGFIGDPLDLIIMEENIERFKNGYGVLSELELKVLELYKEGYSYKEIANKLGKRLKCVDNALHRTKLKLKRIQEEGRELA